MPAGRMSAHIVKSDYGLAPACKSISRRFWPDQESSQPARKGNGPQAPFAPAARLEARVASAQHYFDCSFFIASSSLLPSGTPRPVTGSQPFAALNPPLVPLVTSKKAPGLA
jgi:hypothetical protein